MIGELVEEFVFVLARAYTFALHVEVAYCTDYFYYLQGIVAAHAEFYTL